MQVLKFYFNFQLTGYLYALTTRIMANLFICTVTAGYEIYFIGKTAPSVY